MLISGRPRQVARPRTTLVAALLLAVAVVGCLSGAQAQPAGSHQPAATHGRVPPRKGGTDAAALVDGRATVRKARTTVTLPRVLLRTYANETFTNKHQLLTSLSPAWAVTRIGRHPRFGSFPAARTAVLGFGAVPIIATVHLTQIKRHGFLVPIIVKSRGETVAPFATKPTLVRGLVDLRVSHVLVDRVPLPVGPNCHTAGAVHLDLVGRPADYNIFTGGPLHGRITIPGFTGCGVGGNDLDPLLTGTISGPGNKLSMVQGNLGAFGRNQRGDCGTCRPSGRR